MMSSDRQPSPQQARTMAKIFVIATLVGMLVVFLNVSMRSYSIRMQQAEIKAKKASGEGSVTTEQPPKGP